jgi:multidrug efflux pump subunit AcrB
MNTLMLAVIVSGAACMLQLQRERFPESRPDVIQISVAYPGASPEETEQAICLRLEAAIRSVAGVRKITSTAKEGRGSVSAELETNVRNPQDVLHEIRSVVDQIPRFPDSAEKPQVRLNVRYRNVISVAVLGPHEDDSKSKATRSLRDREASELQLRYLFEQVREELLLLPAVTHVKSWQAKPYQIDVEISEATLRQYGLTHADVTAAIQQANIEVPAGALRTDQTEYLLRINDRRLTGGGIAEIPVVHRPDGVVLTVGDLGTVHDGLIDLDIFARINGRPAMSHEVVRTPHQDMFAIHDQIRAWAAQKTLPAGYELLIWNDYSRQARERLELLTGNALFGLALVFLMLALFLHGRLAFWVAAGIPVALFGSCGVMLLCGATLNMYTMFAFVMALGIVVDDAIVISENVFRHRQNGCDLLSAANPREKWPFQKTECFKPPRNAQNATSRCLETPCFKGSLRFESDASGRSYPSERQAGTAGGHRWCRRSCSVGHQLGTDNGHRFPATGIRERRTRKANRGDPAGRRVDVADLSDRRAADSALSPLAFARAPRVDSQPPATVNGERTGRAH